MDIIKRPHLQRLQPLKERVILFPRGDWLNRRSISDTIQSFALHLQVGACVDLRRADIDVSEEVADDIHGNAALEQVHTLGVAKGVRRDRLYEAWMGATNSVDMLFQNISDTPSR